MASTLDLERFVTQAWNSHGHRPLQPHERQAVLDTVAGLDAGTLRLAQRVAPGEWHVHEWIRRAIILSFTLAHPQLLHAGPLAYVDDPRASKFSDSTPEPAWRGRQVHAPSIVRTGAYVGPRTIIVAGYVAIGARIGDGTVVDGFVNVGSGAQIGENVHLSTGVCIGGVLEPVQERPVIIEDNCFVGANTTVVEGVVVEEGAILGMGLHIGQGTRIVDRETGQVSYGRIPAKSVVMAGTMPDRTGRFGIPCAVITRQADESARRRTALNQMLRW